MVFFGGIKGSGGIFFLWAERALVAFFVGRKGLGAQFWCKRALWGTILVVQRALGHNFGGIKGLGAQFWV